MANGCKQKKLPRLIGSFSCCGERGIDSLRSPPSGADSLCSLSRLTSVEPSCRVRTPLRLMANGCKQKKLPGLFGSFFCCGERGIDSLRSPPSGADSLCSLSRLTSVEPSCRVRTPLRLMAKGYKQKKLPWLFGSFFCCGERGIDSLRSPPSGADSLCSLSRLTSVEPSCRVRTPLRLMAKGYKQKKLPGLVGSFFLLRRERDSNPR
ncbi:hypothetical protein Paes_1434 [Prosthecochloris aestuarii DSM 271]|uniref:Uncharacterized protein n=1 Tax=Prosthecochloris aestuarii (strain DSM 271 / SK 413) TaxID=290512 RepID=B4S8R7_PROA2|nr:hypothetical protein Paes_1434 [Prosthecochloris aestuarii DSM 271]